MKNSNQLFSLPTFFLIILINFISFSLNAHNYPKDSGEDNGRNFRNGNTITYEWGLYGC